MPSLPLAAARKTLSSALYLALCVSTIAHGLLGVPADLGPLALGLFLYLFLEITLASPLIIGSGAGLIGLGLLASGGAAPMTVLGDAALRTLPFLVLFFAVLCLQGPALTSPTLLRIGAHVAERPPDRRFLGIALASNVLGAVLNLAGLLLVLSLKDPALGPRDRLRLTTGAMRGFGAASAWSPLFVAMSAVLAVLPELSWFEIAWRSVIVSVAIIALAWAWNRIQSGRAAPPRIPADAPARRLGRPVLLRAGVILCMLIVPVITLFEAFALPIPIALGLVAPLAAGLWQAAQSRRRHRLAEVARRGAWILGGLPGLRNEAFLFFAANSFGLGLAQGLDPAMLGQVSQVLTGPELAIPALVMGSLVVAGLGVHPIVVVVAVGSVLTPEVLHLSGLEAAICLLVVWGLGAIMSPFSGTVLQVARLTGRSPFVVAWRWNAGFCLAIGLPVSAVIYAVTRLL